MIGHAIHVHRALGPGLLESVYEYCLAHLLTVHGMPFERQAPIPVEFEGLHVACGYRADLIVEKQLLVELKSVEQIVPIHISQTLSYLKLTGLRDGLIINFNVEILKRGLRSVLNPNGA